MLLMGNDENNSSQKFKWMRDNGTPTNDPEFIKTQRILQAVQQNQAMRKAQRERQSALAQQQHQGQASSPAQGMHPQQQQQQQPMPGANGSASNGVSGTNGNGIRDKL